MSTEERTRRKKALRTEEDYRDHQFEVMEDIRESQHSTQLELQRIKTNQTWMGRWLAGTWAAVVALGAALWSHISKGA